MRAQARGCHNITSQRGTRLQRDQRQRVDGTASATMTIPTRLQGEVATAYDKGRTNPRQNNSLSLSIYVLFSLCFYHLSSVYCNCLLIPRYPREECILSQPNVLGTHSGIITTIGLVGDENIVVFTSIAQETQLQNLVGELVWAAMSMLGSQ